MPQRLRNIADPYVLLCEGSHDSEFFTHLLSIHVDLPHFTICSAGYVLGATRGGNTRYTEALDELTATAGFHQVDRVLVVADNDSDPRGEFAKIVAQINATASIIGPPARRFVAPTAPQVKAGTNPSVVVLMLPWADTKGNLDTMCLTAASNNSAMIATCVDEFARCTGADEWPLTASAKMKLRSLLSSSWQADPNINPAYVWNIGANLVPLIDPVFDNVVAFLRSFPTL